MSNEDAEFYMSGSQGLNSSSGQGPSPSNSIGPGYSSTIHPNQSPSRQSSSPGRGTSTEFPDIVHLNVGGVRYTTSLKTLQRGDSMLKAMFSGRIPVQQDETGAYFIDRDGALFRYVLNYLRDGRFPVSISMQVRRELEAEARFFGIMSLSNRLRAGPSAENQADILKDAHEIRDQVMQNCVDGWPGFETYLATVTSKIDEVACGLTNSVDNASLSDSSAVKLGNIDIMEYTFEICHLDDASQAWRWSDRHEINSMPRLKLLRFKLEQLGYVCSVEPPDDGYDKLGPTSYVLRVAVELPQARHRHEMRSLQVQIESPTINRRRGLSHSRAASSVHT